MEILDDIWASLKGSAKTRINDPIIGTFICSWVICNWDRLALLFWGIGNIEVRINKVSQEMAFINNPSLVWINYDLLLLPLMLTVFYIFIFPKLSYCVEKQIKPTVISRHDHSVELDTNKAIKQKGLNKARLRANPKNNFLAQEVEIDINREKSEADLVQEKASAAKSKATEAKAKATIAEIELEKSENQAKNEKRALAISAAKQKAVLASHRFPSIYLFLELLSNSIKCDGITLTLGGLSRCIATIFGYSNFTLLLNDKNFSNSGLENMKYVLLEPDHLTSKFTKILGDEEINDRDSEWLIGHLEMIFDQLPYELIYEESLAENIYESINCNSYELLQEYGVISGMAETDTIFEEVNELEVEDYSFDQDKGKFIVKLFGSASGPHRKESDVPGQGIDIKIRATCNAIIGKFGFSEYKIEADATPTN